MARPGSGHDPGEPKRVTLRDIAESLGISKATVSLAINASPLVSTKTRERVLAKVAELGYVYNRRAASLTTGQTHTVGLAVHDITNPYFANLCRAVEAVLSRNAWLAFLCDTGESEERQRGFITALAEHDAAGLIVCPARGTRAQAFRPLLDRRRPVVLVARELEEVALDFVGNDEERALALATRHLLGLGHRRIAMLGGQQRFSVANRRRAGFVAALHEAGIDPDPALMVDCETNARGGERALREVLGQSQPPSGVVCFNDHIALGAISALRDLGLEPGKDQAVVGCDGIEEGERGYVRLTTVHVRKSAIGRTAAELVLKRAAEPDLPVQRVIFEPALVVRDSCGAGRGAAWRGPAR